MTPARFAKIKAILDRRQSDLTVLMDEVKNPHNVSAVLRTCDAVGILEMHAVWPEGSLRTRADAAAGVARWVRARSYPEVSAPIRALKAAGHQVLAAHLGPDAVDFRSLDYTRPTALILGSEGEGVSAEAETGSDTLVKIPMLGAVTSLNVSVAGAIILFEAQRQRQDAGLYERRQLEEDLYRQTLFEWTYPKLADFCQRKAIPYPRLGPEGEILDPLPRG